MQAIVIEMETGHERVYLSERAYLIAKQIHDTTGTKFSVSRRDVSFVPEIDLNYQPWTATGTITFGINADDYISFSASIGYDEGGFIKSIDYTLPDGSAIDLTGMNGDWIREDIESTLNYDHKPEMYRQWCDDQFDSHQDLIESEMTGN